MRKRVMRMCALAYVGVMTSSFAKAQTQGSWSYGDMPTSTSTVEVSNASTLTFDVTPFSNMESGRQATNPGFRAILKNANNQVIAAGPLTIESLIASENVSASSGSAYGRLRVKVGLQYLSNDIQSGTVSGQQTGFLSICKAENDANAFDNAACQKFNVSTDRPFQWFDKQVQYTVSGQNIQITKYFGSTGEGGTSQQLSLAVAHPVYGFAIPGKAFKDYQSPIVLDMTDSKELKLSNVHKKPVKFDLLATGEKVKSGWIAPGAAFLALDVNGNKKIDSGLELFGEASHSLEKKELVAGKTFENGFLALSQYDDNKDGKIDAQDKIFDKLLVWQDKNMDGVAQKSELKSLKDVAITELSLAYETVAKDSKLNAKHENEVRLVSTFKTKDGKSHLMGDVWFKQLRDIKALTAK